MFSITDANTYNTSYMSTPVNPDAFVITRRRKKYKFAKFHNAANCFELSEWQRRAVDVIEVGAGTGLFSVELAARHPELTFVALDVKADRLQKGAYEALSRGVDNIFFVRARADQVAELATPGTVSKVWLTFPDPFGRTRSAGRRLTHPTFLAHYQRLLHTDGSLYLKHDNQEFFCWSLEQLIAAGWRVIELTFDLHSSLLSDEYKILTTYEQRWLDQGLVTHFVCAQKPHHAKTLQSLPAQSVHR